tara:strand:+ start:46 stop:228 length:183 start_codon:yes stop_codon:yes gene_type:complete
MGKKTSRKLSSEAPAAEKFEESKIVSEIYESDMVVLKKENAKAMQKAVKKMDGEVKQNLD